MAGEDLLQKVHGLSDLELAQLLCLISRQHALISTVPDALDELVAELQLVSTKIFGLRCAVVDCTPHTTLEDFASSILLPPPPPSPAAAPRSPSPYRARNDSYFAHAVGGGGRLAPLSPLASAGGGSSSGGGAQIANVILAKNLDRAPKAVQIQALELLRSRRIFTRTAVQTAPKPFLFLGVLAASSGGDAKVTRHLNDFFFVAHWHDPDDGFPNLEEDEGWADAETASTESVVKKSSNGEATHVEDPIFTEAEVASLAEQSEHVRADIDVVRYQMNIVSFLRLHRAVADGITPTATKHFEHLMRCLAPIHGLDFVTPALVALAARKVYLHRIRIVQPEKERSMQWGSELEAVRTLLDGIGPEDVIDDVLAMVSVPV